MQEYKLFMQSLKSGAQVIEAHGISDTQKALLAAAVSNQFEKSCIIVTHNEIAARKLYEDVHFFNKEAAELLPAGEMIFHRIDARSNEIRQQRLKVISEILEKKKKIICTSVEALLGKLIFPEIFTSMKKRIALGEAIDLDELLLFFIQSGYERVDMVEGKGQFSIRGGIVDFFPPTSDNPIRFELFGDEVDSIRFFDVITQRSIAKINDVMIYPVKELLLRKEDLIAAGFKLEEELSKRCRQLSSAKKPTGMSPEKLERNLSEDIERLKQGIYFEGIEKYISFFGDKFYSLLDYFDDCIVIIDEPNRVRQRCENIDLEFQEHFKQLLESNEVLPEQYHVMFTYDELVPRLKQYKVICFNTLLKSSSDFRPQSIVSFVTRSMHPFHGKINLLIEEVEHWKSKRYRVLILAGTGDKGKRLAAALRDSGINAMYKQELDRELSEGDIVVIPGTLNGGFEFSSIRYSVISEKEVYTVSTKKPSQKKKGRVIKVFTDLKIGDYVVHENHGIGQYIGIEKLKVGGLTRDYLHIRYSGNDKLYIPTDQLDLIQKYIGGEDKGPKLNKLGSAEWAKTKGRARKAIESMAQDLLKLYAERQQAKGFAFSRDTRWQKEFEDMFQYEETNDQLKCIEEIKEDMESDKVMDRLLCGDVGYGKTEVALRAAFKSVMDSKQVAILAPTTILAQQHYNTCIQRFSSFPIKVDVLSRFKTAAEQKRTLNELRVGNIDVIIGTHRLIQNDVVFKELGLLIIDEEQRFGVVHKERIKELKKNVDVLTLSATPIPRTLHMSMTGIRDISIIEEPPEERYPVQTYVMEHNEDVIRDAIVKELARGGQVYYLFNRVRSITKVAARIKELVPEAKVAYAHGQMDEKQLEDTMLDFYNGESNVLVCTTIIESGLDIPNVNTIIITDADKMGLSQLYQLRGRVGRSNRVAYAYFTYQKDKVLNEVAEKRLQAIREFTEFGSGFKIAMRDLEIRGTGNLLGREQHGHMEAIGYDLYIKLLEDTLRQFKGEPPVLEIETTIDIQVNAYIPETYIEDEGQKIEIYKKIAYIENTEEMYDVEEEIEDRFGDIPETVRNLMKISMIRHIAKKCGVISITQKTGAITANNVIIKFKSSDYIKPQAAIMIASLYKNKILFTASEQPYFTLRIDDERTEELLEAIKLLLEKINGFQMQQITV
ncbi:MAG: transcription-repair coupling factor [Bacillota bacterium]